MAKKKVSKKKTAENQPRFEESLSELEAIVAALDAGDLGLEESISKFEQGMHLLKNCYDILQRAEQRIEQLTGIDAAGNAITEPFDATATIAQTNKVFGKKDSAEDEPATDKLF